MDAAIEKLQAAVRLDPSFVAARNKLGAYLLDQGKVHEAEEQFREALHWNPNSEGVLYNMSLILDQQGKSDEALQNLERANDLLPDDPRIMTALAAHIVKTDLVRARELLNRVLQIDPGNAEAKKMLRET